jgi:DNA (cytosine-5)-methyltransferase 1
MKVVDIFSGAGGLGEGFYNSGFNIIASIDNDLHSLNTLKTRALYRYFHEKKLDISYFDIIKNYPLSYRLDLYNSLFKDGSINELVANIDLSNTFKLKTKNEIKKLGKNCDVVIGGPPCQAYSLINTKSRNDSSDSRHILFKNYLHTIDLLKPKAFLFENVVGMTSAKIKNKNIIELFENDLKKMKTKYFIIPKKLNADNLSYSRKDYIYDMSLYGIPQRRKRFILVALRHDIFKKYDLNKLSNFFHFKEDYDINTTKDAIDDLPKLNCHSDRGDDIFLRKKCIQSKTSSYSKKLQNKYMNGIFNHCSRTHMNEDLKRYKFLAGLKKNERVSNTMDLFKSKRPDLLPKHKNLNSFVDRFKVQYANLPSSTITAHISKDGHYFIHYDQMQNRSLTVREAARLQSFKDDYFFEGPRTEQFKMVGNAVPPMFTMIIAKKIMDILKFKI